MSDHTYKSAEIHVYKSKHKYVAHCTYNGHYYSAIDLDKERAVRKVMDLMDGRG